MKKIILSFGVVIVFIIYAIYQRGSNSIYYNTPETIQEKSNPTSRPESSGVRTPEVIPAPEPKQQGLYKDGTYTGKIADAYYGNVQISVIISNGKITGVYFLDYPHDRRTSIAINTQAMPYLKTEAIQAQSAKVDTISGATATSGAFVESLASALQAAKN